LNTKFEQIFSLINNYKKVSMSNTKDSSQGEKILNELKNFEDTMKNKGIHIYLYRIKN